MRQINLYCVRRPSDGSLLYWTIDINPMRVWIRYFKETKEEYDPYKLESQGYNVVCCELHERLI